jgi:ligand-binding sensor domain-containing protein
MKSSNRQKMKFSTLPIFYILILLTSCNGQKYTKNEVNNSIVVLGDTVSELSKSIWIVFQSINGDYWYGSDTDGIFRFDGKTITRFSTKDGLSSNRTRDIQEDKQGNIYISTLEGINKFDGNTFTTLTPIPNKFSSDNWKLQPDDLWFYTLGKNGGNGPCRFDGENLYQLEFPKHYMADEYFEKFPNNAWSPYDVYYIYKDSKGTMWFGTSNFGICRYDGNTLSWLYEEHLTTTPDGGSFGIRSILEDEKGKYWFCNTRYRFNISPDSIKEDGNVLVKYERENGINGITSTDGKNYVYFMSAVKDNEGDIWLATYNEGVWRYDGIKSTHYPVKDTGQNISLFSIYKDKQDQIWLGTHDAGVYKFNGETFEKFMP